MGHQGELFGNLTHSTMSILFRSMTFKISSKQKGIGLIFPQLYNTDWKYVMLVCGLHQIV